RTLLPFDMVYCTSLMVIFLVPYNRHFNSSARRSQALKSLGVRWEAMNSFVRQRAVPYTSRRKTSPFLLASTRQDKPCHVVRFPPNNSRPSGTSPPSGAKSLPDVHAATRGRAPTSIFR